MESTPAKFTNENFEANSQSTPSVPTVPTEPTERKNILPILLLTLVIIFILVSVFLYITAKAKESKVIKIEDEITQVNSQIKSKDQLERSVVAIYGQVSNLDTVLAKRNFWSNLLDQIKSTVSINIQLQSISTSDRSKGQITGKTGSYASLAYYLKSLENSTKISNVSLVSSSMIQDDGGDKIQFTITAAISGSVIEKQATATPKSN
jgi:Tfp pilus assembly protein PilN